MRSLIPPSGPDAIEPVEADLDVAYAVPPPPAGRAHVRANFVAALDGAIALSGRSGGLGGDADRRVFHTLRWHSDAVLVGSGTAIAENYGGVIVPSARRDWRRSVGLAPVPPVVVVSASLRLQVGARLFGAEVRPIVLTTASAPAERRQALAQVADVVIVGDEVVAPAAAVAALAERGLTKILCEGGPSLYTSIAGAGLLDELCLTVAPILAGPGQPGIAAGPAWPAPVGLELIHALAEDGYLFLRYHPRPSATMAARTGVDGEE